ncbi:hypothetical protein, partial [Enterobacter hormaechei]
MIVILRTVFFFWLLFFYLIFDVATPVAAALLNRDEGGDGRPPNLHPDNDSKNANTRKNQRPGEDGGLANPC